MSLPRNSELKNWPENRFGSSTTNLLRTELAAHPPVEQAEPGPHTQEADLKQVLSWCLIDFSI